MQAIAMALLQPVRLGGKPYVLRALQPSEDRIEFGGTRHPIARLGKLVTVMGQSLAWAQLRSGGRNGSASADELIDFGRQRKWRRSLIRLARDCTRQAESDWKDFARACDDGAFARQLEAQK